MNVKVYASDEGFGHIVRQRAIIDELLKLDHIGITLQTKNNLGVAREFFKDRVQYQERFNNLITVKSAGMLDVRATHELMQTHFTRFMKTMIDEVQEMHRYDMVISDLVPEAIAAAKISGKKAFAVCHHTWDWIFEKIPALVKYVHLLEATTMEADAIFFPPLTPDETIEKYAKIAVKVPFIVYPFGPNDIPLDHSRPNVLVLDSGTKVLAELIEKNKAGFARLTDYHFITIRDVNKVHNLIPHVDLVISRGGFNTITDCIAAKTPMLLIDEPDNPEIAHNLSRVSELGLCSTMKLNEYANNFPATFLEFMQTQYEEVKHSIQNHHFKSNGAQKIAEEVMRRCTH